MHGGCRGGEGTSGGGGGGLGVLRGSGKFVELSLCKIEC